MTQWSTRPPEPSEFAGIRLCRVPAKGSIKGLILSEHLIGTHTHYYRQRTSPCKGASCSACLDGQLPRWHGYLAYIDARDHTQRVIELTALAAQPIADFDDRNHTIRGAVFEATRNGNRPNSPVTCTIDAHDTDRGKLPTPVDLPKFLETIWQEGTKRNTIQDEPTPRIKTTRRRPAAIAAGNGHGDTLDDPDDHK